MNDRWHVHHGECAAWLGGLPHGSVDAIVCDPPYGLGTPPDPTSVLLAWLNGLEFRPKASGGFMGREWDAFVPGPEMWRAAYQAMKPGAHLVAFASQRTVDWMTLALRLAGFEVRDTIQWLYWSGFPKSLDVSKEMDKSRDDREAVLRFTSAFREHLAARGITNRQLDDHMGTTGMAGHWTSLKSQPAVPTLEQWPEIVKLTGSTPKLDALVDELCALKGAWAHERSDRVTEAGSTGGAVNFGQRVACPGAPVTDEAVFWQGYGTALKPAAEPAVLARKPFGRAGGKPVTIAANLKRFGTGALNVDGTRHAIGALEWPGPNGSENVGRAAVMTQQSSHTVSLPGQATDSLVRADGRWPANVIYCPKPSTAERERGTEGLPRVAPRAGVGGDTGQTTLRNHHPTLKPVRLMRWLVRLLAPPAIDGVPPLVVDPFTGSGTTGIAAMLEGVRFAGAELDADFHRIACARIQHALLRPRAWRDTKPGRRASRSR